MNPLNDPQLLANIDRFLYEEEQREKNRTRYYCAGCEKEVDDPDDLERGYCPECIYGTIIKAAVSIASDKLFLNWLDGEPYLDMTPTAQHALVHDYAIDNPNHYLDFCEKEGLL